MPEKEFEEYLKETMESYTDSRTRQAAEYSLLAGGKRVRPRLLFSVLEGCGLNPAMGYPAAAALEMVHTYSLIHDDLPAMDNDDLRRGRPTCHKAFDEATAILAGDGLLTQAFGHIAASSYDDDIKTALIGVLAENAGLNGMILGQDLDLKAETEGCSQLSDLLEIDYQKTARLLIAALQMGAIIARNQQDLDILHTIGKKAGIQFQIQDDILDVQASEEQMGKSLSDAKNGKQTAVSLLGLEKAKELSDTLENEIQQDLDKLHFDSTKLQKLLESMRSRTH